MGAGSEMQASPRCLEVLISAPSLDEHKNVSGVSRVVSEILNTPMSDIRFRHIQIGAEKSGGVSGRFGSLLNALRGAREILLSKADIYHSNTAVDPKALVRDSILCTVAAISGKGVVLHCHGGRDLFQPDNSFSWWLLRYLVFLSGRVVVLSNMEKSELNRRYGSSNIEVIYNGVASSEYEISKSRGKNLNIVFLGRLVEEKGIDSLISLIKMQPDDCEFHICGEGALREDIQDVCREFSSATFHGVQTHGQIVDILRRMDVLVLLSKNGEGMPMALLEAMAAGVVPISTSVGSIPEVISDGVTGFLVDGDVVGGSRRSLDLLNSDRGLLDRISLRVASDAREKFDSHKNYGKLEKIYRELRVSQ